jgi:cell division protein FtsL|tara:strand:- start:287 stop:484 length:198 start_codon:yes stop_codon:yes gene_type:complete
MSNKNNALQKIESHEKLCRIMQKQTHDRINQLQNQITRIERILLVSMGSVMTGMGGVIVVLIQKL